MTVASNPKGNLPTARHFKLEIWKEGQKEGEDDYFEENRDDDYKNKFKITLDAFLFKVDTNLYPWLYWQPKQRRAELWLNWQPKQRRVDVWSVYSCTVITVHCRSVQS